MVFLFGFSFSIDAPFSSVSSEETRRNRFSSLVCSFPNIWPRKRAKMNYGAIQYDGRFARTIRRDLEIGINALKRAGDENLACEGWGDSQILSLNHARDYLERLLGNAREAFEYFSPKFQGNLKTILDKSSRGSLRGVTRRNRRVRGIRTDVVAFVCSLLRMSEKKLVLLTSTEANCVARRHRRLKTKPDLESLHSRDHVDRRRSAQLPYFR